MADQAETNNLKKKVAELENQLKEQEQKEEEIKDSEERFRLIFENSPDAYFICDLKGKFIDGNKAAAEMVGYPKEEVLGKTMFSLHLLSIDQIARSMKRLMEHAMGKDPKPEEYILTRKDGSQVPTEIASAALMKFGGKTVVLGNARNMIEQKRAQDVLKKKNDELQKLNELAVQRELRIVELKKRLKELKEKTG